jgi:hypothetical protein
VRGAALLLAAFLSTLAACASVPPGAVGVNEREAIAQRMMVDIEALASDAFGGRKPGTRGGGKTVDYLARRFAEVGLTSGTNDPGNPWKAPVRLTSVRAGMSRIEVVVDGEATTLDEDEGIAVTTRKREVVADGEMVFVGYGAPEIASEQVMGKVAVMLADQSLNPERRLLLEAKQANAVIVVTDDPALIGQVQRDAGKETIDLSGEIDEVFAAVATSAAMGRALGEARWRKLVEAASSHSFTPVDLPATANIEASAERRDFTSYNVIGRIDGTRPGSEAVLLLAHWDHLGLCRPSNAPDRICNGARDNASGVAVMLELARRLADAGPFERDIYVLATTAEEAGLLGARAFVENPPVPLESVVAAFNFDTVALAPPGAPVGFVGQGRTALDAVVLEEVLKTGRPLGNRDFAESFVKRQDAWVLLEEGVPALMLSSAFASPVTAGSFFENVYHSPDDEVAGIELGGAIDDLLLHEALVRRLAIPAAPGRAEPALASDS